MRRVAVTGLGVICALGCDREEFQQALIEGRCGIGPIANSDHPGLRIRTAAEVRGFEAARHFTLKEADMLDRFAQLAVVAAREASRHAGIEWTREQRESSAIVTRACVGGQSTEDQGLHDVYKMGRPRVLTITLPKTTANAGP